LNLQGRFTEQSLRVSSHLERLGWGLLLLAAWRLVAVVLPLRLSSPEWYISAGVQLVNVSPILITGLCMHGLSAFISPIQRRYIAKRSQAARRAHGIVKRLFLLWIPLQVGAAVLLNDQLQADQQRQVAAIERQAAEARKLRGNIRQLQDVTVAKTVVIANSQRLKQQRQLGLLTETLRVCGSALLILWALRWPLLGLDQGNG
jgi:hypothetical protein